MHHWVQKPSPDCFPFGMKQAACWWANTSVAVAVLERNKGADYNSLVSVSVEAVIHVTHPWMSLAEPPLQSVTNLSFIVFSVTNLFFQQAHLMQL